MSQQQLLQLATATEKATGDLAAGFALQAQGFSSAVVEGAISQQTDPGVFAPIVKRRSFTRSLVRNASKELTRDVEALIYQAALYQAEELAFVPYASEMMRPSPAALEALAKKNYLIVLEEMAGVTKELEAALHTELTALFVNPKSAGLTLSILEEKGRKTAAQARTIVNTSFSAVQRETQQLALDSFPKTEPKLALYIGPKDAKNRGFCKVLDGFAIKQKDFAKLNNKQKGASSFATFCGGWNCRHRLMPITAGYAKRNRIPVATKRTISRANNAA